MSVIHSHSLLFDVETHISSRTSRQQIASCRVAVEQQSSPLTGKRRKLHLPWESSIVAPMFSGCFSSFSSGLAWVR
eukprot:m.49730 g.49730  ORF g.49730 m.49730 type:complete len:76 (+) comp11116_c0_seq1:17-244(+)